MKRFTGNRIYLDTNALIDLLVDNSILGEDILGILYDEGNLLFTCPICVHELIYLRQTGKISLGKRWKGMDVVECISALNIEINKITPNNLMEEERLPFVESHRDPADRLIVAQAISDKACLVSCDRVFPKFMEQGLELMFYER